MLEFDEQGHQHITLSPQTIDFFADVNKQFDLDTNNFHSYGDGLIYTTTQGTYLVIRPTIGWTKQEGNHTTYGIIALSSDPRTTVPHVLAATDIIMYEQTGKTRLHPFLHYTISEQEKTALDHAQQTPRQKALFDLQSPQIISQLLADSPRLIGALPRGKAVRRS